MLIREIIESSKSAVFTIRFYEVINGTDKLMGAGSGFITRNHLITNNHVMFPGGNILPPNIKIGFRFGDNQNKDDDFYCEYRDLKLVVGSTETSFDYAVLAIPEGLDITNRQQLEMTNDDSNDGDEVVLLGFPFLLTHMTSHAGRVSAHYIQGGRKCIQLDASVNSGNSGGPLINLANGKVIGIITRANKALSDAFKDLQASFNDNINAIDAASSMGSVSIGNIDILDVFRATQEQMKVTAETLERSSNTGIGIAFAVDYVNAEEF